MWPQKLSFWIHPCLTGPHRWNIKTFIFCLTCSFSSNTEKTTSQILSCYSLNDAWFNKDLPLQGHKWKISRPLFTSTSQSLSWQGILPLTLAHEAADVTRYGKIISKLLCSRRLTHQASVGSWEIQVVNHMRGVLAVDLTEHQGCTCDLMKVKDTR